MEILNTINLIIVIAIGIIAIHNFMHLKSYRNAKSKANKDFSLLYPLVKQDFYTKPLVQQVIENNHEIHEINKKLDKLSTNTECCKCLKQLLKESKKNG